MCKLHWNQYNPRRAPTRLQCTADFHVGSELSTLEQHRLLVLPASEGGTHAAAGAYPHLLTYHSKVARLVTHASLPFLSAPSSLRSAAVSAPMAFLLRPGGQGQLVSFRQPPGENLR